MGRLLTIITSGLAISTCCYTFCQNKLVFALTLIFSMVIVIAGFIIEKKIKTSRTEIFNRLIYSFTKNERNYIYKSVEVTYSYIIQDDKDAFELKKYYTVVSKQRDLKGIDEYFLWTLPSDNVKIETDSPNKIKKIHKEEGWTHYITSFDKSYPKNKEIEVGSVIKNLVPFEGRRPDTFLSHTIRRKTATLILNVKFEGNYKPKSDGVFKVLPYGFDGKPEPLKYDEENKMFTKTIDYPRKGWKYAISWDEEKI